jgi:hypothetical protein
MATIPPSIIGVTSPIQCPAQRSIHVGERGQCRRSAGLRTAVLLKAAGAGGTAIGSKRHG